MKWNNRQFGELEFDDAHVVTFPSGIIGFEGNTKFVIVNDEDSEPFRWLVSVEDPELSFPLIDLSMTKIIQGKYFQQENVTLFAVASIKERIDDSTVNLKSPIVIDNTNRNGKQVVLEDDSLNVRTPLTTFSTVLTE